MKYDVAPLRLEIRDRHPDLAPPAAMGWSFGSTVAHLAGQRFPDRFAGVALYGYWKDPGRALPRADDPEQAPRNPTTDEAARTPTDFWPDHVRIERMARCEAVPSPDYS